MSQLSMTRCLSMVAICLITWVAGQERLTGQTNRLILTESSRRILPINIVLHGGQLSPTPGVNVLWSADTVWMTSPGDPDPRPVCPERVRAPLGAAFVNDASEQDASYNGAASPTPAIEIVDVGAEGSEAVRLVRFSNGECSSAAWSGPEPIRPLARGWDRWIFVKGSVPAVRPSTTEVALVISRGARAQLSTVELDTAWSDSLALVLSPATRGVIVSSRSFPFSWATVGEDGRGRVTGRVPIGNEPFYMGAWIGAGVFALDSGFVQILADLGSDRRHLLIYDAAGAFKRRRVIDVPFGILDTAPDRGELLALRRTDRLEILTYQWSWESTGPR